MTRSPGEVPERAYGIPMTTISDKMAARGVGVLTDRELLTLLTEDGQRADALLAACGDSLARIAGEGEARLRMIGGLGLRRARLLLAAAEFGRRAVAERAAEADCIATSDDVVRLFRPQLEQLPHEECWAVYLTASNRIIERQRVSQGGVTGTVVDHRIVVKRALELLATQLILIHNHPSAGPGADRADRPCRGAVRHPPAGPHRHRPRRRFLLPARGASRLTRPVPGSFPPGNKFSAGGREYPFILYFCSPENQ